MTNRYQEYFPELSDNDKHFMKTPSTYYASTGYASTGYASTGYASTGIVATPR